MATDSKKIYFKEEQRFRQVWLWVLLAAVAAIFWFGFIWQVVLGHRFGNNPAPNVMLSVTVALVGVGLPLFFYSNKLKTVV
ncbi:MAG: hypothetical protein LPJ89_05995 [Hymenobacteraceae bacterium]|nr:hypothetical protein [Hymenobacteraceae bacterium]MDX5397352.1 hypothetical protein [Hymenobacteraceae bacterium]MDX5443321.1 hypothetical protein [Hymenobacteraceae bacterium]MDX5513431.1 hypothetical protein [Hymenobacteraceae bacterium]